MARPPRDSVFTSSLVLGAWYALGQPIGQHYMLNSAWSTLFAAIRHAKSNFSRSIGAVPTHLTLRYRSNNRSIGFPMAVHDSSAPSRQSFAGLPNYVLRHYVSSVRGRPPPLYKPRILTSFLYSIQPRKVYNSGWDQRFFWKSSSLLHWPVLPKSLISHNNTILSLTNSHHFKNAWSKWFLLLFLRFGSLPVGKLWCMHFLP